LATGQIFGFAAVVNPIVRTVIVRHGPILHI
jgi:hypothetical protein